MAVSYGTAEKKKATKLHSELVRSRGKCQRCYRYPPGVTLQCAHIISRRYARTRTLLDNAWCLCAGCHFIVDTHADEKMHLVGETIGQRHYDALKTIALDSDAQKVDWKVELARLQEVKLWMENHEV